MYLCFALGCAITRSRIISDGGAFGFEVASRWESPHAHAVVCELTYLVAGAAFVLRPSLHSKFCCFLAISFLNCLLIARDELRRILLKFPRLNDYVSDGAVLSKLVLKSFLASIR